MSEGNSRMLEDALLDLAVQNKDYLNKIRGDYHALIKENTALNKSLKIYHLPQDGLPDKDYAGDEESMLLVKTTGDVLHLGYYELCGFVKKQKLFVTAKGFTIAPDEAEWWRIING